MQFKKFLIFALCFLCIFSFVGCGRDVSTKALTMDRYFQDSVTSKYSTKTTTYNLSKFTANVGI